MKQLMKIFGYLLFIAFVNIGSFRIALAQTQDNGLDINGLCIGKIYSKTYVISKLGEPNKYLSRMSEFGLNEEYEYGPNLLRFKENGMFCEFALEDNRFAIYTANINGGIKVGDSVNKFQQLGFGVLELKENGMYVFWSPSRSDSPIEIRQVNGIITWIAYSSSI